MAAPRRHPERDPAALRALFRPDRRVLGGRFGPSARGRHSGAGCRALLHFSRPYKDARHYLGFAEDLEWRLAQHGPGRDARLVQVVLGAGIGFEVARTWDGDRRLERRLKKRNAPARLCPICRGKPPDRPARTKTRRDADRRAGR